MKSPNNNQQQKIEKLIKTLGIDLEFTGREIAEILWLSLKRQELIPTKMHRCKETRFYYNLFISIKFA